MTGRREEPRYSVGDVVSVTETIASAYTGRVGRIVHRVLSRYARTLDKYTVFFADSDTETFWDIQLRRVSADSNGEDRLKPQL